MPGASDQALTEFPPFEPQSDQASDKHDSPFQFTFEDHFEQFHNNIKSEMAGAGSPYIKSEPNDLHFNFHNNNFAHNQQQQGNAYNMGVQQNNYNNMHGNGIDPDQLAQNGSFGQNMSSSYNMGNSTIGDDELMDLMGHTSDAQALQQNNFQQGQMYDNNGMSQPTFFAGNNSVNNVPMSMGQPSNMNGVFSSTPEGAPIQSPFVNGFNYAQFRTPSTGNQHVASGSFANSLMRTQHMQNVQNMGRRISESRSPASPHTPGINGLHIGEPEFPTSNMQQHTVNHRHSASMTNNWEGVGSGAQSWNDGSPYSSPAQGHMHHPQISEVLGSGQSRVASSLPAKMEPGVQGVQTQEAKKRRRRESHNLVERRRRDNINERIHDLGNLVPQHRLEDEKVRKHIQTNSPLSPSITATSMSPPQATSLLASSGGKRASTGGITQGLPIEDKDKGPNKGDILNGSVAWVRDIVWLMQIKLKQEVDLEEYITRLGGQWPFERSDDEKRMLSEMAEVVERNARHNNIQPYSRSHGTGLRVPGHTNIAGEPVAPGEGGNNYSNGSGMSPAFGTSNNNADWHYNNDAGFKEEDEFDEMM